jgi:dTDP-4-amino-4,6-dideoxygalactose transaminase
MAANPGIPMLDLTPELNDLWDELTEAIQEVLRSGQFIMGPNVQALEREVAAYLGVRRGVAVNSGTDALVIALRAMGVGRGDEVITTPFTFFATAEAVSILGAVPVFVDIEPDTMNMDVAAAERAVTPRTRAVIPVHLFGHAVDMDAMKSLAEAHGLRVLEDCAQSFGTKYRGRTVGAFGHASAFSFFPTKNLGAYGDGGLIATDDDALADACAMLRVHGSRRRYYHEAFGYNSRLDEIQAAILRVKLPGIDAANEGRRAAAGRYDALLANVRGVSVPTARDYTYHVYHQYTIRVHRGRRDDVHRALSEAGISTMTYYPVPVHRLPVYDAPAGSMPDAEAASAEVLSLPIWPQIEAEVQEEVVAALARALDSMPAAP